MSTLAGFRRIVALGFVLGTLASVWAEEKKIDLDKLPQKVARAVKKRFPNAKMVSAEKETEKSKTVYEVAIVNNKQKIEVTVTPAGKITEIEKQIGDKRLPKAVAEALASKYPGTSFKMIEEVIKVMNGAEKLEYYEVLLATAEKKKLEVAVTPAGKVVKEEDKTGKKDWSAERVTSEACEGPD